MESLYSYAKEILVNQQHQFCYVDIGSGDTTLVFLHGMGSNLDSFQKNIAVLKKDFRCILIDLPGYGKTPKIENETFSIGKSAELIAELLGILDIKKIVLIGHSMGGQIAIKLTNIIQEKLSRLILLSPAGIEQFNQKEEEWLSEKVTVESMVNLSEAEVEKMVRYNFYDQNIDIDSIISYRTQYLEDPNLNKQYCTTIVESLLSMVREKVLIDIAKISIPCLIIFGDQDKYIPHPSLHQDMTINDVIKKATELNKEIDTKLLQKCGHFPQWEKNNEVNSAIINFTSKYSQ
ncbi:alpha/beta fold hydrolase [Portibacter lacus]|uniref:AB hydrolase-1 domain-containing protein n=1 Tax=Portibacter lacus TaxID=1099794 RepID=A0AA37SS84_9BACT|nr:alpha/beta hydrolase [Portibacter lacus]GLR20011.1 hypothetical protein GCM10007940_46270 [Portibacter lacus]